MIYLSIFTTQVMMALYSSNQKTQINREAYLRDDIFIVVVNEWKVGIRRCKSQEKCRAVNWWEGFSKSVRRNAGWSKKTGNVLTRTAHVSRQDNSRCLVSQTTWIFVLLVWGPHREGTTEQNNDKHSELQKGRYRGLNSFSFFPDKCIKRTENETC